MTTPKNWQELALKKLGSRNTMPQGLAPGKEFRVSDLPNFQVYEFSPNKKLDQIPGHSLNKGKRYLISGQEWATMLQTSLLKATHDMIGERLGYNFRFEEWFAHWEEGFTFGTNQVGSKGLKTNYKDWRKEKEHRPGYLEWRNPNRDVRPGFRVIEYFPSRATTDKSFIITGSDRDIVQQIIRYHITPEVKATSTTSDSDNWRTVKRTTQPKVTLYFLERGEDTEPGFNPVEGRLTFRLMNVTDNPNSSLPKITKADLEKLGNKIKSLFLSPTPFEWKKGKEMCCYADWASGYQLQVLCRSKQEGVRIVQQILQIQDHVYDGKSLRHNVTDNEAEAYPTIPPNLQILGKTVRAPRRRPVATVRFMYAKISLQFYPQDITLVAQHGEILPHTTFS